MSEWVITLTYHRDPSMEEMDRWEELLADFDGHASRPRRDVVDVTVHAPSEMDIWDAGRKVSEAVDHLVGVRPVGVEVITEAELGRRADAPTLPELVSAVEIAHELGVSRQRVHKLRSLPNFPAPLAELGGGAVWDAAAVRAFAQQWDRKPGRPRVHRGATDQTLR